MQLLEKGIFSCKEISQMSLEYCQCQTPNKDHQRMMVDPMFMIIQSLRLFLTAVTPTAVAPIAVILH